MSKQFKIFIPTRDSANWIEAFLDEYRLAGLEPIYVLDDRTVDRTPDILKRKGAEFISCRPSKDFAEAGMVEFAVRNIDSE